MYTPPSFVLVPRRAARSACLLTALAFCLAPVQSTAAENPALDQAFQTLVKLELGQDLGVFQPIRAAVVASRTDEAVRADLENRLIAVLQGESTDLAKDYACRQLVLVGSTSSLPALAALVPNARMSYMARYALEGIGTAEARATLRDLLAKTESAQKIGVVVSLGRLADVEAAGPIASLLEQDDAALQEVCLIALGRIGNAAAAEALQGFAAKSPKALPTVVVDAQLDAADSLCKQGEYETAAKICESLLAAESEEVQAAGYRGLVAAKPSEKLNLIIAALGSDQPWKRAVGADCVVALAEPKEIETIAAAVEKLPQAGKVSALLALKDHVGPAVRQAALKALDGSDLEVCQAALVALIRSGTGEDVPRLVVLVTGTGDEALRKAAFEALRLMPAADVNGALVAWMDQAKELPPVVVESALSRRSPDFVPAFLKAAASSNPATRLEAFKALEIMASAKEAEALVGLLCKTSEGDEREAAGRAVWMACQQIAEPNQRPAALLAAMEKGDANAQCAVLPTLARIGSQAALPAIRKAMKSEDRSVRDAGYRALANWPDASVADELLEIAKTNDAESYRIWTLRAYARVVALPSDRPAEKTFEMLRDAMKTGDASGGQEAVC